MKVFTPQRETECHMWNSQGGKSCHLIASWRAGQEANRSLVPHDLREGSSSREIFGDFQTLKLLLKKKKKRPL